MTQHITDPHPRPPRNPRYLRPIDPLVIVALWLVMAMSAALSVRAAGVLQGIVDHQVHATGVSTAAMGLLIVDLDHNQELASINPDKTFMPASNMKLLTTAAALGILGRDFVFTTDLRLAPGGVLIVRGDGDPGFGDPNLLADAGTDVSKMLDAWAGAVKAAGLKKIGKLLVDDRVFDSQYVNPSWPQNQLHRWYCAEVAGLNFADNCLRVYAAPTRAGQPPSVTYEPPGTPVTIDNQATTGTRDALWVSRKPDTNTMILRGSIHRALSEPVDVTVHDPPLLFAQTLAVRLRAQGVEVEQVGRVTPKDPEDGRLLAEVRSTLPAVITRCNRDSQNLFAESLIKRIGHQATAQPGSWANGAAAIRAFLAKVVGPAAADVVIDDGSGLSRDNRVSPRIYVKLLGYMYERPELGQIYLDSLAEPGEEGTLRKRFREVKIRGEVHAKTGYISGVNCLTGYLITNHRTVAFSILVNDRHKSPYDIRHMMDRIVAAADAALAQKK